VEISGSVEVLGSGREGVTINVSGYGNFETDSAGNYFASIETDSTVTLTPEHDDLIFCPQQREISVDDIDKPGIGFQAFPGGDAPPRAGSGGDSIYDDNGDIVHVFCSTGDAQFVPPANTDEVEVLVVAGGGGGGAPLHFTSAGGGGGGAGGVIQRDVYPVDGVINVTVGAGGAPGDTPGTASKGEDGGDSVFENLIALGGGGGSGTNESGNDGGSGGGSRGEPGSEALQPGSASGGFGNRGGVHIGTGRDPRIDRAATGGGGAGEAGEDLDGDVGEDGGDGGDGRAFETVGTGIIYAGGGGGGVADNQGDAPGDPGAGGAGGGGRGGRTDVPAIPGFPATGGGGGGGNNAVPGAWGGSGIVVVRYRAPLNPLAEWRMEEPEWTGAAGEVADSTGNGYNGTRRNAGADTSITNPGPAIPGDPGTCRYGKFDGNSFIEIADFPDLEDSFSITGWFRTRDRSEPGQRIFADDESNINGYAVSLGDGGTGRIRFYHRALNPVSLDTPEVIDNDTWYFVAAVLDDSSQQKHIYIYGASGNLVNHTQGSYTGTLQTDGGTASIGGETSGGETQNRFRGSLDEVRVFDSALSANEVESVYNTVRPCEVSPLDNFEVVGPGTASVCEPAEITIRARDSAGNTVSDYSGMVDLTTSAGNGNWTIVSADGTLSPQPDNDDNGQGQYKFVNSDNGEITLGLSNRRASALTVTVEDTSGGQSGSSSVIQFQENAFVITQDDSLGDDFVAGRNHQLRVRAISRDSSTDECGLVTEYNGNIDLKGWIQRTGDDPGGTSPDLADSAGTDTMPNSEPAGNNTTLVFDEGEAAPQWKTTDVGQYALNLKDDSSGIVEDENGDPLPVSGSSQDWTVRPFGFAVTVPGNTAANSAGGAAFQAAGRPFDIQVRAVQYDSDDDTSSDGQPDGHGDRDATNNADLTDNGTVESFDESVVLSAYLSAGPTGAADPGLAGLSGVNGFSSGQATGSARYNEVGAIEVEASFIGAYLGRSVTLAGDSGPVGRFHPEAFSLERKMDGTLEGLCNGFNYTGQSFGYSIPPEFALAARAFSPSGIGPVTQNYRGDWQKLGVADFIREDPVSDTNQAGTEGDLLEVTTTPDTALLSPDPDNNGILIYEPGADRFVYTRNANARIAPFDAVLSITMTGIEDIDGAAMPLAELPVLDSIGVSLRYGRLNLENAFGPETMSLQVPFEAQIWNGSRFQRHTDDNCWVYNTADVVLTNTPPNTSVDEKSGTLDSGSAQADEELILTAPGVNDTGSVNVRFPVPSYWQDDFDGDGSVEDPTAIATFGVYRGHDRIIYWQEVLN